VSTVDEGLSADAAAEEIVDLYSRHADAWAQARGREPGAGEALHLDRFMLALPPGGAVLDLGCGSGRPISATLTERGFRVTGVDASADLIDRCRREFPDQDWLVSDMRGLDLERHFDGVLAWYSSFHLTAEDQAAMATVHARHLKPGGVLMFVGGPRWGVSTGEWMGRPLHHASLDPAEYRAGLEAAGFIEIEEAALDAAAEEGARVWTARRKTSD
jgi:SAM-dependent methyltransferase